MNRPTLKVSFLSLPRYLQDACTETAECLSSREVRCRCLCPPVSSLKTELSL